MHYEPPEWNHYEISPAQQAFFPNISPMERDGWVGVMAKVGELPETRRTLPLSAS